MSMAGSDGQWTTTDGVVAEFMERRRKATEHLLSKGHRVPTIIRSYERWDVLEHWCKTNLGSFDDWMHGPRDPRFPSFFAFRHEEDAFLFRLMCA